MAQVDLKQPAETGTDKQGNNTESATPKWDSFEGEQYPFLNLNEEQKRAGFRITFLSDRPRKETKNSFNEALTDFWFDVVHDGNVYTWTISQVSLIMELRKHKSLKDKTFNVKLVPVDSEFKKQYAKFKGTDRYEVTYVGTANDGARASPANIGQSSSQEAVHVEDL